MRSAVFKPTVPSTAWPAVQPDSNEMNRKVHPILSTQVDTNNRHKTIQELPMTRSADDEYGIEAINDFDILRLAEQAEQGDSNEDDHIDDPQPVRNQYFKSNSGAKSAITIASTSGGNERQPARLPNGRYKCKHFCKDKTRCKHLCCREGLDEPPKVGKKFRKDNNSNVRC